MLDNRAKHIIAAVCVATLLVFPVRNFCDVLDLTKHYKHLSPTPNAAKCVLKDGFGADGFEDMVYLSDTTAIGCAGDNAHLFFDGKDTVAGYRQTVCALVTATPEAEGDVTVEVLEFVFSSPQRGPLHLHGLDVVLQEGAPPLLVGIHHGFGMIGDTVELFHIFLSNRSLVHRTSLPYVEELRAPLNGVTNDVAVLNPRTLFVSKYLELPDGPNGRVYGARELVQRIANRALLYLRVAVGRFNTEVLRCDTNNNAGPMSCSPAVTGILMANGIIVVPLRDIDVQLLITVDVLTHRLVIANANGPFPVDSYAVPHVRLLHTLDNVNPSRRAPHCVVAGDVATCTVSLLGGVVGSIWHASKIENMKDLSYPSPGGTTLIVLLVVVQRSTGLVVNATLVEERLLVMHNGSFQGTSVGLALGEGTIVMGSFKVQGLLVCPS